MNVNLSQGSFYTFDESRFGTTSAQLGVNSVKMDKEPNRIVVKMSGCPLVNLSLAGVFTSATICFTSMKDLTPPTQWLAKRKMG